jgi:hypothetical protein
MMPDPTLSESAVRNLIFEICVLLHQHGIREVSVGAIMRLVGVPDHSAEKWDAELLDIASELDQQPPPGTVLH